MKDRLKQTLPAEILGDLMGAIRSQFYPDSFVTPDGKKQWFQDQNFLKSRVVLWPAGWLNKRGVTLKPERYKEIILGVFTEIKRNGNTGAVKFWPGYLAKCVQERFAHQEEEIYAEGKALRSQIEHALFAAGRAVAPEPDPIQRLAEARDLVASKLHHSGRHQSKPSKQLNLL